MKFFLDSQAGVDSLIHYLDKDYHIDYEADLDQEIPHNNEAWQLGFSVSKELDVWSLKYAILVIKSLAKTIFSLGIWLIDETLRDDWSSIWNIKKVRQIYSAPNDPITPALVQNCMKWIQELAPKEKKSINCAIENSNYKIWWNFQEETLNVEQQRDANDIGDERIRNILSIESEGNQVFTNRHRRLINGVVEELYKQQKLHNNFKLNSKDKLQQGLQLLQEYLEGPNGNRFRYNSDTSNRIPEQLNLNINNENIKVWMRISGNKHYINFQILDEILEIKLDKTGKIESAFANGELVEKSSLNITSKWKKTLTNAINCFLDTNAINKYSFNRYDGVNSIRINVHPLGLSQRPETVLKRLCENGSFPDFHNFTVKFLQKGLLPDAGSDSGGPKRQFVTELAKYLLDGSNDRVIKMLSGIPALAQSEKAALDEQIIILQNLGKMMSVCYSSNGYVMGRVLPDNYFGLLEAILKTNPNKELNNDEIIRLSEHIWDDKNTRWMLEIYKNPRELNSVERTCLINLGEDESDIPDKNNIKNWVRDYFNLSLKSLENKILAAQVIAQGMMNNNIDLGKSVEKLSTQIQGEPFSRQDIAKRINCRDSNPIVMEKAKWLQELILDEKNTSEEWIKGLLKTITGMPVVVASTDIDIYSTSGNNCIAHTCSKYIEIPNHHIPPDHRLNVSTATAEDKKQWFKENLLITMAEDGFTDT